MIRVFGLRATRRFPLKPPTMAAIFAGSLCKGSSDSIEDGSRRSLACELRPPVEVEFADDLGSQQIALQNLEFGLQFGRIVVIEAEGGRILKIQSCIGFVDFNRSAGLVDRCHLQAGDGDHGKDRDEAGDDDPFALE